MSMTYEGTDAQSLTVYVAEPGQIEFDDGPNDVPLLMLSNGWNQFALAISGDFAALPAMIATALRDYDGASHHTFDPDSLNERVYDALMAAGHRALADEYAEANGAGK